MHRENLIFLLVAVGLLYYLEKLHTPNAKAEATKDTPAPGNGLGRVGGDFGSIDSSSGSGGDFNPTGGVTNPLTPTDGSDARF